jgi:hypothetical protein
LEHGGLNESTQHYQTVTYWYGLPAPALIQTDDLILGDKASERRHRYVSPDASAPYEIASRYELGPDTLQGREIYPAETDRGRTTKTTSEFTLRIDPRNFGVMLRRKLDYSFPNQRAEVFVADAASGPPGWKPAGVWYLAGSNTCVFSSPGQELGATQHVVQTSNRRFRDDEFLLPLALTRMFHRRSDFVVLGVPVRFGGHCGGVRAGSRPGCGDRGGLVASDSPSENAIRTQFDRSAKCATGKSFVCRAEFSAQQRSAAQTCPNTCCQG